MTLIMNYRILSLLLFFVFSLTMNAQDGFENPVIKLDTPDPTVIRGDDGYFYAYSTNSLIREKYRKIPIFKSENLTDWTFVGEVIDDDNYPPIKYKGFWAPDANKINGKFVLYIVGWRGYVDKKDQADILIYVADSAAGPYEYKGILISTEECGFGCIDPELVVTKNNQKYLFWGTGGIWCTRLTDDGMAVVSKSDIKKVCSKWSEGAYVYRYKKYYYLFVSRGSYSNATYRTLVGRSKNIEGPYVGRDGKSLSDSEGVTVLAVNDSLYGSGHNGDILKDDKGNYWISYHCHYKGNANAKWRSLAISQLFWDKDGWPYVEGNKPKVWNANFPYWK